SDAVRLQGILVYLDAEAGTGREVQHSVAHLALDRGDGRGEEALGGEAVGEMKTFGVSRLGEAQRDLRRRRDPYRPVEGAGDVGGEDVGDRQRRLGPAHLRELDPGVGAGSERGGLFG